MKLNAVKNYYKINNYSKVYKIFEYSKRSLKKWIEIYEKNKSVERKSINHDYLVCNNEQYIKNVSNALVEE